MKRLVIIVLACVLLVVLLGFSMTYQVRFTEAAVLTTFGKASEDSLKLEPGLKFKWPSPIQSVTKYDTRLRVVQTRAQTQQTRDNRQIIVEATCFWRVKDPLRFYERFSIAGDRAADHFRKAQEIIESNLRSAIGATSKFAMSELFNASGASKLPDLEKAILSGLVVHEAQSGGGEQAVSLADYGIEAVDVGVTRVMLPEDTTKAVFERMGANRDRLAAEIEAKGQAVAQAIRDTAENEARMIRAFADSRAQEIRKLGDREAATYLKQMNSNPELAVFLRRMEFLRDATAKRMTFVFPTSMPGFDLVKPDALNGLKKGEIPKLPDLDRALAQQPAAKPASNPSAEGSK